MIRAIESYAECREFVRSFDGDPRFSDPMLQSDEQLRGNLIEPIERGDCDVFGIYFNGSLVGLFSFLVLSDERYAEMLVGLSRELEVFSEMLDYLERRYPGYSVDFVFNPANRLLKELLTSKGAEFEPEQRKMRLHGPILGADTSAVELYSERYAEQYFAIHDRDRYWTGEKVAAAQDRFRTLLAIHDSRVVGYMDVTRSFAENEPYDLFISEEYRRMGYDRALLTRAVELNQPAGMSALINADDAGAKRLYESVGFVEAIGEGNVTAHLTLTERK